MSDIKQIFFYILCDVNGVGPDLQSHMLDLNITNLLDISVFFRVHIISSISSSGIVFYYGISRLEYHAGPDFRK